MKCNNVDPKITLLWGASDQNPGWTQDAFDDENNHSVVMRIDFGASSLLITGDLEDVAIQDLVEHYRGSNLLDVDVYQVGHHGSANATTEEFLAAITPEIAVIAMGSPTREFPFTAFEHGHPRKVIVDSLERHVSEPRDPITVRVATGQHTFEPKRLRRAIYATCWDGSVVLEADTGRMARKGALPAPFARGVGPSISSTSIARASRSPALPRIGRVRAGRCRPSHVSAASIRSRVWRTSRESDQQLSSLKFGDCWAKLTRSAERAQGGQSNACPPPIRRAAQ